MKYLLCICLAVAASLSTLAADPPDDAKALQGNWKPAKAELAGQPMADAFVQSISLKLDHGKYEVFVGDKPDRGTYTIDSTTTPRSMTITGTEGPNNGKTFPAIYELNGDTLRICYDLSGAKRPAEFKTIAATKLYLVTYHRKKKQVAAWPERFSSRSFYPRMNTDRNPKKPGANCSNQKVRPEKFAIIRGIRVRALCHPCSSVFIRGFNCIVPT